MRLRATILGVMLVLCVGCGPQVLYDKTVTVTANEIEPIIFGPFEKETAVTVEAESVGAPASVLVHPEDQTEHVDYAISYGNEVPSIVAGSQNLEKEVLKFTVPAETEMVVRLQGTGVEQSQVKLRIIK